MTSISFCWSWSFKGPYLRKFLLSITMVWYWSQMRMVHFNKESIKLLGEGEWILQAILWLVLTVFACCWLAVDHYHRGGRSVLAGHHIAKGSCGQRAEAL
jgi:hypothetical protein